MKKIIAIIAALSILLCFGTVRVCASETTTEASTLNVTETTLAEGTATDATTVATDGETTTEASQPLTEVTTDNSDFEETTADSPDETTDEPEDSETTYTTDENTTVNEEATDNTELPDVVPGDTSDTEVIIGAGTVTDENSTKSDVYIETDIPDTGRNTKIVPIVVALVLSTFTAVTIVHKKKRNGEPHKTGA
ncbi:MAG: hypothetical protein U0M02_02485 [Acutalibacteraceae bacterium]|nr:hypothetical protein [Acutalibacteraceae bacterium]